MTNESHFTAAALAKRWERHLRTIDRLRQAGKLPWIDISGGRGANGHWFRFIFADVERFEQEMRQAPGGTREYRAHRDWNRPQVDLLTCCEIRRFLGHPD